MRKEFYTGHLFDVYRYFGAHKEGENFIFRVFAPSAKGVCCHTVSCYGSHRTE